MRTIIHDTPGLIDLRVIKTMGVNVKESGNAIGYFGTGLKYAIATLLRNGQMIEIWRGSDCHKMELRPTTIRGREFHIVHLDDEPIGITSELGKNWQNWQAFRELHSNTLDESGQTYELTPDMPDPRSVPPEDRTLIVVQGSQYGGAYDERDSVFLSSRPIDGRPGMIEAHALDQVGVHCPRVYYRGVRAGELGMMLPTVVRWNVLETVELTEDRTLKHLFAITGLVSRFLCQHASDEGLIRRCLTAPEGTMEYQYVKPCGDLSDTCVRVLAGILKNNPAATRVEWQLAYYQKMKSMPPRTGYTMSEIQKTMLRDAIEFCRKLDFYVDDFPIEVVTEMDQRILGLAQVTGDQKRVFLTDRAFDKGTKHLAQTLIEEYAHLKYGLDDETRKFQDWLLERITNIGELHVLRRPL